MKISKQNDETSIQLKNIKTLKLDHKTLTKYSIKNI